MTRRRLNKECLSLYEEFRGNKGHGQVTFTIRSLLHGPLRTHNTPQITLVQIWRSIYGSSSDIHCTLTHSTDISELPNFTGLDFPQSLSNA